MPLAHQPTDRSCQLQLEFALLRHRCEIDLIYHPPITQPNYQYSALENLRTIQKRVYNSELLQHYRIALNIRETNRKYNNSPTHKIGHFLLEYFQDEFDAILHLENVSPSTIQRLTSRIKQRIISERPPRIAASPAPAQGLASHETNDLWRHLNNKQDNRSILDDLFDLDSPRSPSRKRCRFNHPSVDDTPYAHHIPPPSTRSVTPHPVTDLLLVQNIVSPFSI